MKATSTSGNEDNTADRRKLFKNAMQGNWDAVVDLYKRCRWLGREKITRGGNTALHIAVSDGQESFAEQLVAVIVEPDVLEIKNNQGNTPLHLAASVGSVSLCKCIPSGRPHLVGVPNEEGETPLFLAARNGKMDAFFCLLWEDTKKYVNMRNDKGETVLHCAINGGHFKLAFRIIKGYRILIDTFNEQGATPLHVLANKPGGFRSGTHLSLLGKLIYHCVLVQTAEDDEDKTSPNWVTALRNKIGKASTGNSKKGQHRDEADNTSQWHMELDATESLPQSMTKILQQRSDIIQNEGSGPRLPPNYDTCFSFISLLHKAIRGILFFGTGLNYLYKIKKKKETNIWSVMVMDQLLKPQPNQEYDYYKAGWNRRNASRTPYYNTDGEKENRPEQDGDLPDAPPLDEDLSETNEGILGNNQRKQGKGDEGTLKERPRKEGSSHKERNEEGTFEEIQKRNKSLEEGRAAKNLVDEHCMETEKKNGEMERTETPILIAAKNGITEMVKKIIEIDPLAIHDIDLEEKNTVLLAVENRHPHLYELLLNINIPKDTFGAVDKNKCSALHLAARLPDNQSWLIPGAALQMQWEVMWYEYVKRSMPPNFFPSQNKLKETAKHIFTHDHKDMVEKGKEWLNSTATACSLVATLIATVAFATSTAIPGGTREGSGKPYLEKQAAFHIFAISSLIALCFSVFSTIMFLAILTSRHQERDFRQDLPAKLLLGLTSLFISILSILVTFCAGHFFVLKDELRIAALPVYAVTCLPAAFFALAQLPLYLDLIWATFSKVPQRWEEDDT